MKKIIIILFLMNPLISYAQELFIDKTSQQEYLFLGGINNEQIKLINSKNHTIQWINRKQLEQIDRLTPTVFSEKIAENNLVFNASGDEPFWGAKITQNMLSFLYPSDPDGKIKDYSLAFDTIKGKISYIAMFKSKDNSIYGVIRANLEDSFCELAINEEESVFDVFINYQGEVFQGCATLDKE